MQSDPWKHVLKVPRSVSTEFAGLNLADSIRKSKETKVFAGLSFCRAPDLKVQSETFGLWVTAAGEMA